MTITPHQLPGKFFAASVMFGKVVEPHQDGSLVWHCDQFFADGRPAIPRLLGVNLLRTARYYDNVEDARRAGWDVKIWDAGETVEL